MSFIKQDKDYNCAAYAIHMLLKLNGIDSNVKQIEHELGCDVETGTSHHQIVSWFDNTKITRISYGYLDSIYSKRLITPYIVNYQYCDENGCDGHYGVVITHLLNELLIYNPATGGVDIFNKEAFDDIWYSERYGNRFYFRIH